MGKYILTSDQTIFCKQEILWRDINCTLHVPHFDVPMVITCHWPTHGKITFQCNTYFVSHCKRSAWYCSCSALAFCRKISCSSFGNFCHITDASRMKFWNEEKTIHHHPILHQAMRVHLKKKLRINQDMKGNGLHIHLLSHFTEAYVPAWVMFGLQQTWDYFKALSSCSGKILKWSNSLNLFFSLCTQKHIRLLAWCNR